MSKALIGIVAILALAGCYKTDIAKMSELKQECDTAGGVFTYWQGEFSTDQWKCDLSTEGGDNATQS